MLDKISLQRKIDKILISRWVAGGALAALAVLVLGAAFMQMPTANAAADKTAANSYSSAGNGIISETRLYQLVRQSGTVKERTFDIRFLDPGVGAYAFSFG